MEMQGSRTLPVAQNHVWDALNNPDILKACIPGCNQFELTQPNEYAVVVALKIGPVSAKFTGKVSLMDIVPPNSYALQFEAQGGVAGFGKGTSKVLLTPTPKGCELSYAVSSQVGGKIAQLGQRLIDGAAKSLAEDFFQRFENELLKLYPASATTDAAAMSEEKTHTGTPEWVWLLGAVVVAVSIWFIKH